jgi:hypothetical protein
MLVHWPFRPMSRAVQTRLEITIYNPSFDDGEHSSARTLAQIIGLAFAKALA